MSAHFTTSGLSRSDVLPYWRDIVCSTYVPVNCKPLDDAPFGADLAMQPLGRTHITHVSSGAVIYERNRSHLKGCDQDGYLVSLLIRGRNIFSQGDRSVEVGPGAFCLYDLARPYRLECPEPYEGIHLKIPRMDLNARLPAAERLSAVRMAPQGNYSRLAATMLTATAAALAQQEPDRAYRLVDPMIDLIALAFDEALSEAGLDQSRYGKIVERAQDAISAHLFDPNFDLSRVPGMIGVSTRTLSRAFAQRGITPSRWFWQKRLDAAREMLASNQGVSVSEVAITCGFNDFSHFSRSFRQRFGVKPSSFLGR